VLLRRARGGSRSCDGYLVRVDNQVDDNALALLPVFCGFWRAKDDSGPDWRSGVAGHWSHRHEEGLSVADLNWVVDPA